MCQSLTSNSIDSNSVHSNLMYVNKLTVLNHYTLSSSVFFVMSATWTLAAGLPLTVSPYFARFSSAHRIMHVLLGMYS